MDPSADDATAVDLRGAPAALPAAEDDAVEPGTRIGRYHILEIIGSGGVGIVYAAYDPSLDRKVALKQLRRSKLVGQTEAVNQRRMRLRREAQALARLSHPNVVPVYEVATFDDQIYVVMEFVEGSTLGAWLGAAPRTWSEIVAVFVQAGRGLAAAHAADIVHRDFKPENVRVGNDGRVRVLDFGLAASLRDAEPTRPGIPERLISEDSHESWSDSREELAVTREGQVMGTPAYMAPEQASAGHVDARSDQFSFCVALYEALYGVRPFRGNFHNPRRFRDLSRARSLPGSPPEDLPSEIERVLIRGLSIVPERRFATLDELLVELTGVARGPRRLWWVLVSLLGLAAASVFAFAKLQPAPAPVCDDGHGALAGVWDEVVAAELGNAVATSVHPYAGQTWATARTSLDAWAQRWRRARLRACEATQIESQSETLLEHRIACLDLQLIRFETIISGLRGHEDRPDELLERLPQLALPSLEGCAAAHILVRSAISPTEPEAAAEAQAIRELIAEAEGLLELADFDGAIEHAEEARVRAETLGFAPVEAEATLSLGLCLMEQRPNEPRAEALLREAAWIGQGAGVDSVVARAAAALAQHFSHEGAQLELAEVWAGLARVSYVRHGSDSSIEPDLRRVLGHVAMASGDYETALGEFRRALDLARELGGEQSPGYIAALQAIGDAERELGRFVEAGEALRRARVLATEALGAAHPTVAEVLDALANVESERGDFAQALALHHEALAINEASFGLEHRRVATNLNNLAIIYNKTGRYGESIDTLERARGILVELAGPAHPDVAFVDVNLGAALENLDRHTEAIARYEAALAALEASFGPAHMSVGVTLLNLGGVRVESGDPKRALDDFDRAEAVLEQAFGTEHPSLASLALSRARALRALDRMDEALAADLEALRVREALFGSEHRELVVVLTDLAATELALDQLDRARGYGERALGLAGEDNTPAERAEAQFVVAQIRLAGDDPETKTEAEALARAAVELLAASEANTQLQAELEAWLAANFGSDYPW